MITTPMDVLKEFPIRKTKAQKQSFRDAACAYAQSLGYPVVMEKCSRNAQNIVIGDPKTAKFLVTAHYDTPASIGLPNFLTPCNLLVYLLYQLLVVGFFFVVAIGAGVAIGLLVDSADAAGFSAMAVYWALLLLMLFGPANKSNANDNTSGVVSVLEIARTLPENLRKTTCFILFDLEEAGLVGSASYRKQHKQEIQNQLVLNMDCVGDGDHLIFFPTSKTRKNAAQMSAVRKLCGRFGDKEISLREKGFYTYPSDQRNFPCGFGIAAFHKSRLVGYYCDKIHTKRDTILEETNVNLLRAALTTLISDAACENA